MLPTTVVLVGCQSSIAPRDASWGWLLLVGTLALMRRKRCGEGLAAGLFAVLLLMSAPALAGPVVLHGPGMDSESALAEATRVLGSRDFVDGGALATALGVDDTDLVVIGGWVLPCHGEPEGSLADQLVTVRELATEMDYGRAVAHIEQTASSLPCFADDATPEELFELYVRGGIASFHNDQFERARAFFARAAALNPSRTWPREYHPTPKTLYMEAFQGVLSNPPANLSNEVGGPIVLDGAEWGGEPRLYLGSHILWVEDRSEGIALEVPQRDALANGEIVLTTGAQVVQGLLHGEARYGSVLSRVADGNGWGEVVLVSTDSVVVTRQFVVVWSEGEATVPDKILEERLQAARRAAGPSPLALSEIGVIGAGLGLGAGGTALYETSRQAGRVRVGEPLLSTSEYDALNSQNRGGLVMASVGVGVATTGLVMAIVGAVRKKNQAQKNVEATAVLPWLGTDGQGATLGLVGRIR